jgi:hypothetical protein
LAVALIAQLSFLPRKQMMLGGSFMMPWTLADFKDLASIFQSLVTPVGLIVAGVWAYRKYIAEESRYPHIQTSAEITFVGRHGDYWICELNAILENKGKVQHKIAEFRFDLNGLYATDIVKTSDKWGGQALFPHAIAEGSFKPEASAFFFIDPGVSAKYTYVARVPKEATMLMLHCRFKYADPRQYAHTMETTVATPRMVDEQIRQSSAAVE